MKATEKQKQAMKEYAQRPEVKTRRKEYMKKYHSTYSLKNKDAISERKRKHYEKNKDMINNRNKAWMEQNREKFREYAREYYLKNKDKIVSYGSNWEKKMKKENECFAIKKTIRSRLKHAFNNYSKYGKTRTSDEYGIDYDAIIQHLKPFPKNRALYNIDHIKPLCSFDLTDPEQVRIACSPENHQWLLKDDNMHKISSDKKQSLKILSKK